MKRRISENLDWYTYTRQKFTAILSSIVNAAALQASRFLRSLRSLGTRMLFVTLRAMQQTTSPPPPSPLQSSSMDTHTHLEHRLGASVHDKLARLFDFVHKATHDDVLLLVQCSLLLLLQCKVLARLRFVLVGRSCRRNVCRLHDGPPDEKATTVNVAPRLAQCQ